ncbi:MAG: hypothetical protein ACYTGW_06490 [Planctomycetota bacterium]
MSEAVERILLGESMQHLAHGYREQLLVDLGMDPEECEDTLFLEETHKFMSKVCAHLGEKFAGDARASAALQAWVRLVEDYDAFDALLSNYDFAGREVVIRRGKMLFPGPLTAHWE